MIRKFFITGILLFVACGAFAQNVYDVKINEILVKNVDNYEDDYGNKEAWIELYNSGHSSVNIGGCYLTVKLGDDTMTYRIPTNDSRTVMGPLSYKIFFCEGTQTKGTFHTNFTLDQTGYLAFLSASRGVIDELKYNVDEQVEDISIGRFIQGDETVITALERTTPMSTNETIEEIPQHEQFRMRDPSGIVVTVTAMGVVFAALIVLFLFFKVLGNNMVRIAQRKESKSKIVTAESTSLLKKTSHTEEEAAAIALAMKMYQEDLHDKESVVLTINRVARAYSPWSSKIYGLRQMPNKK